MKQLFSINELAAELKDIRDESKDISIPANHLDKLRAEISSLTDSRPGAKVFDLGDVIAATEERAAAIKNGLSITVQNGEKHAFIPTNHAHGQIATYADIPKAYYDRLLAQNPQILADNINHGINVAAAESRNRVTPGQVLLNRVAKRTASGRMLRTHRGKLRAVVSTSYRRLDNHELIEPLLPVLADLGFDFNYQKLGPHGQEAKNYNSFALTEQRMYIKLTTPKVQTEVRRGDVVQFGLCISNSDVGAGSVRIEPFLLMLSCDNGMVMETALRQAHLGRNVAGDDIEELLSDATKALDDKAFFSKVRDVVIGSARPEVFERAVNKLREADGHAIKLLDLPIVVERTLKEIGVSANENVRKSILDNLADGAHGRGLTQYGLANAFTWAAGNADGLDYDAATELERAGGRIIEIGGKGWEAINAK